MAKLTLSVDEEIVEAAKRLAEANGTSVSAMFARFIKGMASGQGRPEELGPLTRKARGMVRLAPGKDYRELLAEALDDKYRTDK